MHYLTRFILCIALALWPGQVRASFYYAAASAGGGGDTSFITSVNTPAGTTAPFGELGMKITVGATPITVTELGIYGNTVKTAATMDLYIRSADGAGTDLGHGTATWGAGAQFYYVTLSSPVVLSASTSYYIMAGPLVFEAVYDISGTTTVTWTAAASLDDAAFGQPPTAEGAAAGKVYGPLDFKYH